MVEGLIKSVATIRRSWLCSRGCISTPYGCDQKIEIIVGLETQGFPVIMANNIFAV